MTAIFETYLDEINRAYLNGDATEHTHRPALKTFVEALKKGITATNEPKRQTDCGAPDMKISRKVGHSQEAFGYIECKDIGVDLRKTEKSEQLKRYLPALDNLILTDYIHFRLYRGGELVETAVLAKEGAGGKFVASEASSKDVQKLFGAFFMAEPVRVSGASDMAKRMAGMGQLLRGVIVKSFDRESEHGALHGQYEAFKKVLLHDMKEDEFADMYAQTICYGLFAARCYLNDEAVWGKDMHAVHHGIDGKRGEFTIEKAAYLLPKTNPFLRNIFGDIAGPGMDERIRWIVEDLVGLLREAHMDTVLKGFGRSTKRTDPVIHFYETFLAAYDPKLRESRGVYYTPEPVVSYIVRSVDWLLKEKFGLRQGLADKKKIKVPRADALRASEQTDSSRPPAGGVRNDRAQGTMQEVHRCLVLDPAAGTGTFLYEVIKQIHGKFRDKGAWNAYVREHLLPRLFGFELMMAPYAICHMKLGLELADTGYDFGSDERLGVYLTNTLEEAEEMSGMPLFTQWLAEEARAANRVKRDLPIMVVLGNPPYSGLSANMSEWTDKMLKEKLSGVPGGQSYYEIDGRPLGEKKVWLQDDYVKFIRYGQYRIEQTGSGILAFITNHGYLDNPTFRGMRQSLMKTFSEIYILDLHGNSKKKEVCPDGSPDKNVFDILQGVSIGIFVKEPETKDHARVYHADLWGERKSKYEWLVKNDIEKTKWSSLRPNSPYYFFIQRNEFGRDEYERFIPIQKIAMKNVTGIVTARDKFVIDFTEDGLIGRMAEFRNPEITDDALRTKYFSTKTSTKYKTGDTRGWKLTEARKGIQQDCDWRSRTESILYRPFDYRRIYYNENMVDWPRTDTMPNLLQENIALIFMRQVSLGDNYTHFLITKRMVDNRAFYSNKGIMSVAPLYLYPLGGLFTDNSGDWTPGKCGRVPNLDKGFVEAVAECVDLVFVSDGRGDFLDYGKNTTSPAFAGTPPCKGGELRSGCAAGEKTDSSRPPVGGVRNDQSGRDARVPGTFGPEDVFAWIYGVFHSPEYRTRYAEFLKIDFPRVPLPKDKQEFENVCAIGHELAALHLMESPALDKSDLRPRFGVEGSMLVESGYPKYDGGKVFINEKQYFEGVRADVWEFMIGGYQVCEKWLKDRRGRTLSYDDIEHYQKICAALAETIRLMADERGWRCED